MTGRGRAGEPARPTVMTFLKLPPHVSFCRIRGTPVFLDLRRDRYFRLMGAAAAALDNLCSSPDSLGEDDAATLRKTGLFVDSNAPASPVPAAGAPIEASLVESRERSDARLAILPQIALGLACTRLALNRRRLPHLVDAQRRAHQAAAGGSGLEPLARDYLAVRPLIPVRPNCLLDSLTLARFLRAHGATASLVFGVKLEPFGAHCWLQHEEMILNDSVGNATDFTPILVA